MATRPTFPLDVLVGGRRRHVVGKTLTTWIEQESSGRLVHHVGKLLLDGQEPTKVLDAPKVCKACKQPSWTGTVRSRAHHDTCEGWTALLPDEFYAAVVFGVAADLGAAFLTPIAPTEQTTKEAPRVHHAA